MRKLREILLDRQIKETFDKYLKTRKSQVGQANRNEKIRTYNFNQDRLTDHRLSSQNESKGTIFNLESFFQNPQRLDDFIEILRQADRERELVSILEKL
jgi:peptide chain release factor 1